MKLGRATVTLLIGLVAAQDELKPKQCAKHGQREICKLEQTAISITDDTRELHITVKEGGRRIKCKRESATPYKNTWHGMCDGDANDATFVSKVLPSGVKAVFGSIHVGEEVCQFSRDGSGKSEVICKNQKYFKEESDPHFAADDDDEEDIIDEDGAEQRRSLRGASVLGKNATFGWKPNGSRRVSRRRLVYDDSGKNLDLMVLWTKKAECLQSDLPAGCELSHVTEDNMLALIDLAVEETNTAFSLSGVDTQIRLVHAYRDESYVEAKKKATDVAVDHLRNTDDDQLEDAHTKRALYGADLVSMIVGGASSCGSAYVGPTSRNMFSVVDEECATGMYSFGHELVHNLGAYHDRATHNHCDRSGYKYGYKDPDADFRTIMSYDCRANKCDNLPKNNCQRIQRFSNTVHSYNGKAAGDENNNVARLINERAAKAAAYFPAMDCEADNECDDENPDTYDTCNTESRVCVFSLDAPLTTQAKTADKVDLEVTKDSTEVENYEEETDALPDEDSEVDKTEAEGPEENKDGELEELPEAQTEWFMETKIIQGISNDWKTISLDEAFVSPVPVCTIVYPLATKGVPAPSIVRIQNVGKSSFDVRLQNPNDKKLHPRTLQCLIVEEGQWEMPDGRKIEAYSFPSVNTDNTKSWVGERRHYKNDYTRPVILGQVITANDPKWSVFWQRGVARNKASNRWQLYIGKHVGEDPDRARKPEDIGYIVMEAGHSKFDGFEMESALGGRHVYGYQFRLRNKFPGKSNYKFKQAFPAKPLVTVLSQASQFNPEGSWPVLTIDGTTENSLGLAVDEDQKQDKERNHWFEMVYYASFSKQGSIHLTPVELEV